MWVHFSFGSKRIVQFRARILVALHIDLVCTPSDRVFPVRVWLWGHCHFELRHLKKRSKK